MATNDGGGVVMNLLSNVFKRPGGNPAGPTGQNNPNNSGGSGGQGQPNNGPVNNPENSRLAQKPLTNDARNSPAGNKVVEEKGNDGQQLPQNPLDSFAPLWQPNVDKDGKPIEKQPTAIFKPDTAKLTEAVSKMNFAQTVNPEIVKKALGGDPEAFGQAINSVAQTTFQNSLLALTGIMERALAKQSEGFTKTIDERVRSIGARESIRSENPAFAHPAVAPLLESISQQFQAKFPEAGPAEIKQKSMEYLVQIAALFNKSPGGDTNKNTPQADENAKSVDFSNFFGISEGE